MLRWYFWVLSLIYFLCWELSASVLLRFGTYCWLSSRDQFPPNAQFYSNPSPISCVHSDLPASCFPAKIPFPWPVRADINTFLLYHCRRDQQAWALAPWRACSVLPECAIKLRNCWAFGTRAPWYPCSSQFI